MQLTKGSEYALRGLAILASHPLGEAVSLADIAATQSIPAPFLAKVFQRLVRHGVLVAAPGPGNGYALARPASEISVRQILEGVEGPRLFQHCLLWRGNRADGNPCPLHNQLKGSLSTLTVRLEQLSLAEVAGVRSCGAAHGYRHRSNTTTRSRGSAIGVAGLLLIVAPSVWATQTSTLSATRGQMPTGQENFQALCAGCHTIGGGRLVGPDLQGVSERRSEQWIIRFVQHSQQLVAAGDRDAVALFEEFNRIPMPDQPLSDEQIRGIIEYTRGAASAVAVQPAVPEQATDAQIVLGQALFQGNTRFTRGGPTCNSCHEVTNDAVIGGGVLARELTTVFSRLGGPGVRAILGSPPFPVMQRAYAAKPLTDEEVAALVGFLQRADEEHAFHQPRDYGPKLFASGIAGAAMLLGLCALVWRGRLKGSVNQAIYDRQIKSG